MAMFLNRLVSWAFGSSNKSCVGITPPAACGPAAAKEERYACGAQGKGIHGKPFSNSLSETGPLLNRREVDS